MKCSLLLKLPFISLILLGCNDTSSNNSQQEITEKVINNSTIKSEIDFSIADCIKNALYFLDDTDIKSYDSLNTQYFNRATHDKREYVISITKNGLKLLLQIDKLSFPQLEKMNQLTNEEAKQLNFLLDKMRED